jgi:hypothetical protein
MPRQLSRRRAIEQASNDASSSSNRRHGSTSRDTKVLILAHAQGADPFTLVETSIPALAEIFLATACRQLPSLRFESRIVPRNAVVIHTPCADRYLEAG